MPKATNIIVLVFSTPSSSFSPIKNGLPP
ncbi:hypothetical protein BU114_13870 [Staphylococcus shinii]|nr:hypothetical protein BU114_13870 [Staphylococcus shinii]RIM98145.1 DUF3678 domain-containing protein [Staphylococcus shinii]